MKSAGVLALLALTACGGGQSDSTEKSIRIESGPSAARRAVSVAAVPRLGAHVLVAQNDGAGTSPVLTPAVNTQASGSTFIAFSAGWGRNYLAPTDSYGNSWAPVSGKNAYVRWPDFYTAIWAAPQGVGGPGHTLTFNKSAYRPADEISAAFIEVTGGGRIDYVFRNAPASDQSPGSITVDGPATLIAIWSGDAYSFKNTAVPDNGFSVIDSYLNFVPDNETAVQVAIATKEVTAAGTYTVRWSSSPSQGCNCYLIAVRNTETSPPPADTTPPTGTVTINGGAETTAQRLVSLALSASDNASGVAQMRVSNDGVVFSPAVPYATTLQWGLAGDDGLKTVYVQFQDGAGNWSPSLTKTINLSGGSPRFGLVAAYGFDEEQGSLVADASGSGLPGLSANASRVVGRFGNALQFTGQAGSMVTVADAEPLRLSNAFTVSAWVRPQATQTAIEPTVIAKEGTANVPYVVYAKSSGAGPIAYAHVNGGYRSTVSPNALAADTWSHLVATYNGSTLSIYVNGVLTSSASVTGSLASGAGALRIGGNSLLPNENFNGAIDEVRIYNRALSASEIVLDMQGPVTAPPPAPDTVPPTGSLSINGGATSTAQTAVTLGLSAVDNASGVTHMRFSNDGNTFGNPIAFASTSPWTLSAGDGVKTVYAQFRDGAGNWSAVVSSTITLVTPPSDTTPPVGSVVINGGATSTSTPTVTLSLTATDDATGVTQMRFSNDGVTFSAASSFSTTASWSLSAGNGVKQVFAQFRDGAGNWSNAATATITLAIPPATGGLVAAYGFNENQGTVAADSSGNRLNGTVSGATWVAGRFGRALNFTGRSTSRVTVPSSSLLQLSSAFTLSAWVYPATTQSAEPTVVAKEVSGGLPYVLYSKGSGVGPNAYVMVNGAYRSVVAPSFIPANTWSYLTATYDGATLSIYVNGVKTRSEAVSGPLRTGSGALRIGNNAVFGNEGFNGRIDEVRVYSRALTTPEILSDMQSAVLAP